MSYDNYYNILNLSKNANINDIKKAYRQLSIKFHPDKNKICDPEQFNKINEAYSKLLDKYNTNEKYNINGMNNDVEKYQTNDLVNNANDLANAKANDLANAKANALANNANDLAKANANNTILKYSYLSCNNSEDIIIDLNINFNEAYSGCNKPIVVNRKIIVNNVYNCCFHIYI